MSDDLGKVAMAMESPTSLASRRLGRSRSGRAVPNVRSSDSGSVATSVRSRRSASLIRTVEDAELFVKMSSSTGIVVKGNKTKARVGGAGSPCSSCSSPVNDLIKGAESTLNDLVSSSYGAVSPLSSRQQNKPQTFFSEEEKAAKEVGPSLSEIRGDKISHEDDGDGADEERTDLDLFNNDNSYYILASLLIDFIEERIFDDEIVLQPEDADQIERILPESARLNFIEATRFRLQKQTSSQPRTPIEFITLECRKIGLDRFGSENPVLAALSLTTDEVSLPVIPISQSAMSEDELSIPFLATPKPRKAPFSASAHDHPATVAETVDDDDDDDGDDHDIETKESHQQSTMSETVAATIAKVTAATAAIQPVQTSVVAPTVTVGSPGSKSDVVMQVLQDLDAASSYSLDNTASFFRDYEGSVNTSHSGLESIKTAENRSVESTIVGLGSAEISEQLSIESVGPEGSIKIASRQGSSVSVAEQEASLKTSGQESGKDAGKRSLEGAGQGSFDSAGQGSLNTSGNGSIVTFGQTSIITTGQGSAKTAAGQESVSTASHGSVLKQSVMSTGKGSVKTTGEQSIATTQQLSFEGSAQGSVKTSEERSITTTGQGSLKNDGEQSFATTQQGSFESSGKGTATTGKGPLKISGERSIATTQQGSFETSGQESVNTAGQRSMATTGQGSLKTAGEQSFANTQQSSGQGSVNVSGQRSVSTTGQGSLKLAGEPSIGTTQLGSFESSVKTAGQRSIATTGQGSLKIAGEPSIANTQQGSFETSGEGSVKTAGQRSVATTGKGSLKSTGERSIATTQQGSFESSVQGSITTAGQRSVATTGQGSLKIAAERSMATTQQGSFETAGQPSPETTGQRSIKTSGQQSFRTAQTVEKDGGESEGSAKSSEQQSIENAAKQSDETTGKRKGKSPREGSFDEVVQSRSSGSAFSVVKSQFTSSSMTNSNKSASPTPDATKESHVSFEPTPSVEKEPDLQGQLEAEKNYLAESVAKSFSFDATSEGNASSVNIAKQQLLAELREANKLVNNSVTPETTKFWQKHVNDLQARLSALKTPEPPKPPTPPTPQQLPGRAFPGDIVENNRRLLSEFQQRDQPFPPGPDILSSSKDSSSVQHPTSQPLSEHDYDSPMVDVVSPADLPGGYHFEAELEGQRFLATVPPGGVQQGETFTCYMRELDSVAIDIPVGYWKDDPQDVCKYGCCHPVVWNSFVCPLLTLSQIQTRVNLDFLGRPKAVETALSNRSMMFIVMGFWLLINLGLFMGYNIKWYRGYELSVADWAAVALINGTFAGFVVFVTQSTRSSIREKFLIREERWNDLEDLGCATMCLPCTVSQMSRHTANYEAYEAVCCSKTGLPDGVRVNQVPKKDSDYII